MANPTIVPKKSVLANAVPTTAQLALGEIAINHADKKLYARHPATGDVQEIGGGGAVGVHSHDELYSLDSSKHLELQNNGDIVFTDGATSTTLVKQSSLSSVATSGDYNDLSNKPTSFTVSATPPSSPSAGTLWLEEGTLRAFVYYDSQWVEFGLSGSQSYEVRHAYAAPYSYTGTAVDGTSESASGWTVTRLEISSAGTTTKTTASGVWNDRASLTYT